MSTYYKFVCEECRRSGGFFTRQAWGWGNVDIIDSFQFLMKHADECGHKSLRVASEYDDDYSLTEDKDDTLQDYFPRSNDWGEEHEKRLGIYRARKTRLGKNESPLLK